MTYPSGFARGTVLFTICVLAGLFMPLDAAAQAANATWKIPKVVSGGTKVAILREKRPNHFLRAEGAKHAQPRWQLLRRKC